jgi:hypothetical protein
MTTAVIVLMIITSIGVFGFLSKAHSDQNLVSGEVLSKISLYDEKIKTARENINANRKTLKQMDDAVDQVMARSSSETGADKAVALARSQLKERSRLQSEIQAEQKAIVAFNEERAPIAVQVRQVEAKVGPIKYIAALIYSDNPDANILEKAVTWVIIVIVGVFDPLAIIMLLAAQMSFQWLREKKKEESDRLLAESKNNIVEPAVEDQPDLVEEANAKIAEIEIEPAEFIPPEEPKQPDLVEEANAKIAEIEREPAEFIPPEEPKQPDFDSSKHPYLYTGFSSFKDLTPMVHKPDVVDKEPKISVDAVSEFVPATKVELYDGNPDDFKEPGSEKDKQALTDSMQVIFDKNEEEKEIADIERPGDYLILPDLEEESKKKHTFMIKQLGQQVVKTKK